ncbi:MAG TPA: phosphate ABC transporter substrate-binding protein [Symbiobacteriaceae bacterium]|nr:phosphate ABC transporter substrate-binding protein [Symbiobacteriaceae bacterium]
MRLGVLAWCMLLVASMAGCRSSPVGLQIAGSTSVQPVAEMLAEAYARVGGARVSIQGGGSTAGVQAVLNGVAAMGAISRRLTPGERAKGLVEHTVAYDVLTVVVHPDNPLTGLTRRQLKAVFGGAVSDWGELKGAPGAIHLISREAGSGSREAFRSLVGPVSARAIVQNSSGAIRVAVMDDPQAIGYVSLGTMLTGRLKALAVDGKQPGEPGYALVRPLSLITLGEPAGEAAQFLRFALSPAGQRVMVDEGLVPVREKSARND